MDPIDDFDALFSTAWEKSKAPLERELGLLVPEEPGELAATYTVFDPETGTPHPCHLCGKTDEWVMYNEKVAVCEHGTENVGRGSIPRVSSFPVDKMVRAPEPTGKRRLQRIYEEE